MFFDQVGPAEFLTNQGIDVRPHPHIGLATVTYLYKGEIQHRDSIGTNQMIHPGEVNWMIAGNGVTQQWRNLWLGFTRSRKLLLQLAVSDC